MIENMPNNLNRGMTSSTGAQMSCFRFPTPSDPDTHTPYPRIEYPVSSIR